MYQFFDSVDAPNSTYSTVTGSASSGFTLGSLPHSNTTLSFSDVHALAGETLYTEFFDGIFHVTSAISIDADGNGMVSIDQVPGTGASTDTFSASSPSTTIGGTTIPTTITINTTETTSAATSGGTTVYSGYNTRNKQSSTFSASLSSRQVFTTVSTNKTGLGMTETTTAISIGNGPYALRGRYYADTAAGEVLLIYQGKPGVIWEGNGAFHTAESYETTFPGPNAWDEVNGGPAVTDTSSQSFPNPMNGLSWNVIVTVEGTSSYNYIIGDFNSTLTTSLFTKVPLTFMSTFGGGTFDDIVLFTGTDAFYEQTTSVLSGFTTISDYSMESTAPKGAVPFFTTYITTADTTYSVQAVSARPPLVDENFSFSTTDVSTTFDTDGSSHEATITVSSANGAQGNYTLSRWSMSWAELSQINTYVLPPKRVMVIPQGGWQSLTKNGVDNPLLASPPVGSPKPLIGAWGGVLVAWETDLKFERHELLNSNMTRQVSFAGDPQLVLGAPVVRVLSRELERFPWGGAVFTRSGRETTTYFEANITSIRSRTATDSSFIIEPITVSTAVSSTGEAFPGNTPNGEQPRPGAMFSPII